MNLLPKWVLANHFPALHDFESLTVIEQTARVYGAMQTLINEYNAFAEATNEQLASFTDEETEARKEFELQITKVMNEFMCSMERYLKLNLDETATAVIMEGMKTGTIIIPTDSGLNKVQYPADAAAVGDAIRLLEARVNGIASLEEGSTTADAELIDVRVGFDGTQYDTAGNAVRGQAAALAATLNSLSIFSLRWRGGWVGGDGSFTYADGNTIQTTGYIPCVPGIKIECRGMSYLTNGVCALTFYDENFKFIGGFGTNGTQNEVITATPPENAAYVRFTTNFGKIKDTYIKFIASTKCEPITQRILENEEYSRQNRTMFGAAAKYIPHAKWLYGNYSSIMSNLYSNFRGDVFCTYDIGAQKPTGKVGYVSSDGNDNNDGLTPDTPKATLESMIQNTDVKYIHLTGMFNRVLLDLSGRSLSIVGHNAIITGGTPMITAWNATANAGVYYAASGVVQQVFDMRTKSKTGRYEKLRSVSSLENVVANPGTWFRDADAGIIYVHLKDSAEPTVKTVKVCSGHYSFRANMTNSTLYMEGITFYGGGSGDFAHNCEFKGVSGTNNVLVKKCKCMDSAPTTAASSSSGFWAEKCNVVTFQECESNYNGRDGFSYGNCYLVTEYNCVAMFNGTEGQTNANGSSMHYGNIARIGGVYSNSYGNNVHDVGTDTASICISCAAFASMLPGYADYCVSDGAELMILDSCVSYSSDKSAVARGGSELYTRNLKCEVNAEANNGSTVTKF